jgi:FkbM family methyltransferase
MDGFSTIRSHTFLHSRLREHPVVLDLGANRGEFSAEMHARFGGSYYLVEPNPQLTARYRDSTNFTVVECAVVERDGPVTFHVARNDEGSSVLPLPERSEYDVVLDRSITVEGRSLGRIISTLPPGVIDLVKMDIEGAEIGVLDTLADEHLARIAQLTVEFHGDPEFGFDLGGPVERTLRRLSKRGFVVIDPSRPRRRDVLLVNRRLLGIPAWKSGVWTFTQDLAPWLVREARMKLQLRTRARRLMRSLRPS